MGDSRFDDQDSMHSMFGAQRPEQAQASRRRREITLWALLAAVVLGAVLLVLRMG